MPEGDVLYSDVAFTRTSGNTKETVLSSDETTYSEVKILKTQPPVEQQGLQQEEPITRSKVTERATLLVLCVLLAAAVVGLGVVSFDNSQKKKHIQKLEVEFEALKKNHTQKLCETKPVTTAQPVCPKPTEVKIDDTCPKCEEGWELHGGKCYYFSTRESTWNQSRDYCRCRGGDLVKIDSREEQSFLELRLRTKMEDGDDKFWIGLTDSKEEGKWLWVDDSPLNTSLAFWGNTQPDNWTGNNGENLPEGEDCVLMGKKSGADDLKCWADVFCKSNYKSICEKSAETGRV
ncbi:C-type lectin domain family 4 member A-like isoform X2 [Anabas testudineus]|uniref:C-type lectin domain-containing protein n=1 Tax=Anabas testudineus TaxID=64144 RepID=A0A7N6B0F1_ANATE|nr:C-type lectin domain family 4 member A-like isoform X2 [Anabas testudineus]